MRYSIEFYLSIESCAHNTLQNNFPNEKGNIKR